MFAEQTLTVMAPIYARHHAPCSRGNGEVFAWYKHSEAVSSIAHSQPHLGLLAILDAGGGGGTAWKVQMLTVLLTFFHHCSSKIISSLLSHLLPKWLNFPGSYYSAGRKTPDIMTFLWKILQWFCEGHVDKVNTVFCFLERIISNIQTQMLVYFSIC